MNYLHKVRHRRLSFIILVFFILNSITFSQVSDEYMIKAVLIEKITRFVEWPEYSSYNNKNEQIKLYVFGENPFNELLEVIYQSQKINGRDVDIKYINKIEEIDDCHILFISGSVNKKLDKIIEYTRDKPILTISETKGFGEAGVIVNFFIKENKIAFEINESALNSSELYMSFRLLSRAKIINPTTVKDHN